MKCSAVDCDRASVAKGMCLMHYKRHRKHGTTEARMVDRRPLAQRFHEKYRVDDETACWERTGACTSGYGVINEGGNGRTLRAHRVSYELHFGPIPDGAGYHGMCVLHRCDNPRCVNPAHLFLGTNADNVADMDAKGRRKTVVRTGPRANKSGARRGVNHPAAKLTRDQIDEILSSRLPGTLLADEFAVNKSTVSKIRLGKTWGQS